LFSPETCGKITLAVNLQQNNFKKWYKTVCIQEKFLQGKGVPNLSKLDIHVVCGTIKYFLRSLCEPLVTNLLWQDFVKAAENPDPDDSRALLYQAISELPQPNRDTLAFLIMHLQR
jgi:Rac GTPase-activating protein 1